jgi:hypothetical protein
MRAVIWGLLLAACKREPPAPPPPPPVIIDASVATHVRLPRFGDGAIRGTTRPLSGAQLARLAAIEHADFERQDRGTTATSVEVRHTTRTRPRLAVTVQIAPCGACPAIDTSARRRDELLAELPAALRDRPETRVELATRQVAGVTAAASYELGAAFASDEHGQPAGDYLDAYRLDYHDGVNRIRVTASYVDDAVGSVDRLRAVAPREDLEQLAVAFLGFYVHQWQ